VASHHPDDKIDIYSGIRQKSTPIKKSGNKLLDPWDSDCSKEKNKHIYVDSTKKTIRVKPKDKHLSKERAKSAIGSKPHRNQIYNRFDDLHYQNYISYQPVR
jgi:hypothetical protein